jgi:hypothetical protein
LLRKLRCVLFLKNLELMHDALEELGDLSEAQQGADITLSRATREHKILISHRVLNRSFDSTTYV